MRVNSILKKEGIVPIQKLDTLKVNSIARSISLKLCLAFPEYGLNKNTLFSNLSRINMYIAKMPQDFFGAKYFYKNNSIYFHEGLSLKEMASLAVHECIHYIQQIIDNKDNIVRMGLSDLVSGLGINEAAVQLMSCEANLLEKTKERYYSIDINTISPNYYPLQCTILTQMAYFTGTYPLYHSTLNSNDIFKNTFVSKSDDKTYENIQKNLDQILELENDLHFFSLELQYTDKISSIRLINYLIEARKKSIINIFFKTQNLIIKKCFTEEFNNIRNKKDIRLFIKRLYNFKNVIGSTDDYSFYNNFYVEMMSALDIKREKIEQYGEINLFESQTMALTIFKETKQSFAFFKTFISKIKKLFDINQSKQTNVNDF